MNHHCKKHKLLQSWCCGQWYMVSRILESRG